MNKVFKLKIDSTLPNGMKFKQSQEFQISMDVLYMGGHPVEGRHQQSILNWITANLGLFEDVTYKYL